ncbi:Zinc finger BED domain-containing protein RICESLEEPER 2 [Linum grandiflorum]
MMKWNHSKSNLVVILTDSYNPQVQVESASALRHGIEDIFMNSSRVDKRKPNQDSKSKKRPRVSDESSRSVARAAPTCTTQRFPPTSSTIARVPPTSSTIARVPPTSGTTRVPPSAPSQTRESIPSPQQGTPQGPARVVASSQKGKQHATTSIVWQTVMRRYVDENGKHLAECTICKKSLQADAKKNGTSSLKYHAERCQQKLDEQLNKKSDSRQQTTLSLSTVGLSASKQWVFNQQAIQVALAEMIIIDELPFRFVEHYGFIRFMVVCCPEFKIPCRKTIRAECVRIYLHSKERMKNFFADSCAGRVSITTDTWTSNQNFNYMCITAHYVGNDWELHKKIINFTKITSHKGDDIGEEIAKCLEEWGLKNLFTVTLDNASANDVACSYLKKKLKEWGTDFMDGRYLHVRCVAHITNLVVNDGLNEIGMSVRRVREAVRWVRSSPARTTKFNAQVEAQGIESKKVLSMDCPIRWNSTFLMLETASIYASVFSVLQSLDVTMAQDLLDKKTSEGVPIGPPTAEDWKSVKHLTRFLKFFHGMTLMASGVKYCTVHKFLGELCRLYNHIRKATSGTDEYISTAAWNIRKKIDKYWDESVVNNVRMNKIFYIATLFDPRHKMHFLDHCFTKMYSAARSEEMLVLVKEEMVTLFHSYLNGAGTGGVDSTSAAASRVPQPAETDIEFDDTFADYNMEDKMVGNSAELDRYLTDAREGGNGVDEEFNILGWWKAVGSYKYPTLCQIAKDILAIPISSVASESAFSNGGRVLDDFRSSLLPSIVEALICTEDWLRNPDDPRNDEEDEEEQIQFAKEIAALDLSVPPGENEESSAASAVLRPLVNQFVKTSTLGSSSSARLSPIASCGSEKVHSENNNYDGRVSDDDDGRVSDDDLEEPCMDGAEDDD